MPLSLRRRLRPCDTVGRLRKENWDRSHDPREAMVGGLAHSGRVIFAAGAVMVAVFLNVRPVRAAAAEADGDDLRHRGAAGRAARGLMLLPILLRLTGWAAWWLPAWLDRLLSEVRFGH